MRNRKTAQCSADDSSVIGVRRPEGVQSKALAENSCNVVGVTLECGGRARNERRRQCRTGFQPVSARMDRLEACPTFARVQSPPKAAWRLRFPPHSKASRGLRPPPNRRIVGATFAVAVTLRAVWLVIFLALVGARADDAAPKPPDRRELWVPVDKLGFVLKKNAVLLTREQYETLLRDAEIDKGPKSEAPVAAMISSAEYRAVPDGKTAVIHAELLVNVMRDGWCEVPLDFPGAAVGEVKLDGEGVFTPPEPVLRPAMPEVEAARQVAVSAWSPPRRPSLLLVRGRGEHRISFEMTTIIRTTNGVNGRYGVKSIALNVPGVAAGSFALVLPAGATMEKADAAMRVSKTAEATTATVALSPSRNAVAFEWKAGAENDAKIPVRAQAIVRYDIDAEKISGSYGIHLEAPLGDLPLSFEFALPAGVKVLAVRAEELRGWEVSKGTIVAKFQDGARKELDLEISVELQPVIGKDATATVLPMPVLQGASRLDGILHIAGADNVTIKDVTADARMRRMPTSDDRGERGFFGAYEFSGSGIAPKVVIERAMPGLESDLDTLVEFRSDAIFITRTLTLREQKGRRFSTAITLPAAEEFLDVRRIEEAKPVAGQPAAQGILPNPEANTETEPEWTREGGRVLIKWSDEAAKPRVFRVRTRIEPEKWTQLPAEGISLALGDAKIADSAKVTGYIALTADPAFRIEAQPGETLERRDGRSTPVHGEYAWFRRDAFDLTIKIARRPSEVLAALTGYVLPLEGFLDVRASMNYQFMGGGTRAVKIRVPKDLAQNFHFEGPQIAERALDGDVWTVTFQKELTGAYALSIAAQVPVAKQAGDGKNGAKGYSFAVKVPVISPLDVVRASGLWAVEANTETEIRFDARGMNELDSLLAPQLADYAPRHRVIGVFGWLGADYALALNGVRHAPAGMLAAVVDALELNTVISTSGTHRHEAIYRLRASGVEYFDVALPQGAALLSAAIDGTAVKPVADRPGSVRLPLPAKRDANTGVIASLVYETSGGAWKNRGKLALGAPSIAAGIPVLKSTWRVWVPEGFSFSDIVSNLPVPDAPPEELLVLAIGRVSLEKAFSLLSVLPISSGAQQNASGGAVSTGRMMVSGQLRQGDSEVAYSADLINFFGTQIELMQSGEVLRGAKMRVHSMHPELPEEEVKLEVRQLPNTAIFELKAFGKTPVYTQAFLDAVMDEYIASKKEMRANKTESMAIVVQDELVRLEKDMQKEEEEMHAFQKENNIGFLREDGSQTAKSLGDLNRKLADVKTQSGLPSTSQSRREALRIEIEGMERSIKAYEAKALDVARRIADWDKIRSKIDRTKVQYDRLNGQLRGMDVHKNLDQDTVAILEHASRQPGATPSAENFALALEKPKPAEFRAKPQAGRGNDVQGFPQQAEKADAAYLAKQRGGKVAGLLPVMLDLPKTGPALVFDGLYAPERLVMRYDDWWSRARALWMWFVSGGIAFYLIGARRPWWRTLWAVLVMSALPLCVSAAWMPVCNALLGGWFSGLVLNRVGAWCVFRVRKEVLA